MVEMRRNSLEKKSWNWTRIWNAERVPLPWTGSQKKLISVKRDTMLMFLTGKRYVVVLEARDGDGDGDGDGDDDGMAMAMAMAMGIRDG